MRRAKFLRKLEFIRVDIQCNDLTCSGKVGTDDGIQSNTAETNDCDGTAGFDLGGVDDGTDTGDDRTAEYRDFFKWNILIHFDDGVCRNDRMCRKTRDTNMVMHIFPVHMQPCSTIGQFTFFIRGCAFLTQGRPAFTAGNAVTAARYERTDDMIADFKVFDMVSDLNDFPGRFMSESHRRWAGS